MVIVDLGLVAHDEQAPALEVGVERAARRLFRADGHPSGGPERKKRDRPAGREFVKMIVVGRHTVLLGAIEIEPDARKRNPQPADHTLRGQTQAWGKGLAIGFEPISRGQAGNFDFAVVHSAAFGLPIHPSAQLAKPVIGFVLGHEAGGVDDVPARIVHEDGFAGFEEGKLVHLDVCLIFAKHTPNRVLSPCGC